MRKSSRHRFYSPADLERIRCLRETINTKKVSIAGVRRLLALIPCWKMYSCAVQERESCPAFLDTDMPCWSLSGKPGACGTADCRQCPVYHDAADCSMIKQIIVTSTISSGTTT